MDLETVFTRLKSAGVSVSPGLTPKEMEQIQQRHGFQFPPDFAHLLAQGVPVGPDWPDWRDSGDITVRMAAPLEGILFDIEYNDAWFSIWGTRPKEVPVARRFASEQLFNVPKLIPVFSHRYVPALPSLPGNPIFSVYQTDIILFGADLEEYFRNEFPLQEQPGDFQVSIPSRAIDFWSELALGGLRS